MIIILRNRIILPMEIGAPNKSMLSAPPIDEIPNQSILIAELEVLMPNKLILLAPLANEMPN